MHLIIGTYTEPLPFVDGKAEGIATAEFDPASGRIGQVRPLAAAVNPSYLVLSPAGDRLYAVCETGTFAGERGGGLIAFARDTRTGELTRLNARPTVGESPCHLALVRGGRFVVVANYGEDRGSVTVFPVEADGGLGERADHVEHAGSGPNAERQASSHAHMIAGDPVTGDILVPDLGADTIFVYSVGDTGRLSLSRELKTPPGAGPRHVAFHPDGQHLFVVGELASTVSVWRRDPDDGGPDGSPGGGPGGFTVADTVPALPPGSDPAGDNLSAAIRVSPSGRHVLVTNRGHDSIAVFGFDPAGPALRLAQVTASQGECPRDFILTPDGRRLIAASQDSDVLASYEFDDARGTLRLLHRAAALTPVCLALV